MSRDSIEKRLERMDQDIISLARRYQRRGLEMDDLAQVARIAAWEAGKKVDNPIYMFKAAQYAIFECIRKQNAKKRAPWSPVLSLDRKLYDEKEFSDYIADKQPSNLDMRTAEKEFFDHFKRLLKSTDIKRYENETITEFLRETFGGKYIRNMRRFSEPKKLAREIIRTTIEDIAKIPKDRIAVDVNNRFFVDNKLWPLLWVFYNGSSSEAKIDLYPHLKPWHFKHAPQRFWKGKKGYEHAVEAVKEFCDEKGIKSAEDCRNIRFRDFADSGYSGVVDAVFSRSPYLALKSVFPELRREDKRFAKGKFPDDHRVKQRLLEYFIEIGIGNIEGQTIEELFDGPIRKMHLTDLRKKFSSVISNKFNGSAYDMLSHYFPDKIRPWLISSTHNGWKKGKRKVIGEAVRWLLEDYLNLSEEEIPRYANYGNFHNVGFDSFLRNPPFSGNLYNLINNSYPGRFTKEQFDKRRKVVSLN